MVDSAENLSNWLPLLYSEFVSYLLHVRFMFLNTKTLDLAFVGSLGYDRTWDDEIFWRNTNCEV